MKKIIEAITLKFNEAARSDLEIRVILFYSRHSKSDDALQPNGYYARVSLYNNEEKNDFPHYLVYGMCSKYVSLIKEVETKRGKRLDQEASNLLMENLKNPQTVVRQTVDELADAWDLGELALDK